MLHGCIVGPTECGKSYLAKQICQRFVDQGRLVLVLESIGDKWPCHWQTEDQAKFLQAAKTHQDALLVIDEADENVGRSLKPDLRREMWWLPRRARHNGHQCLFIMQDYAAVEPVFRKMADTLYLFDVDPDEADYWRKKFNQPKLLEAPNLPAFHFFKVRRRECSEPLKI